MTSFFTKHQAYTTVINGLDTSTNSHDPGRRNIWSGRLADGNPTFCAMVAACRAPEVPMAFLSHGGYDFTAGLVPPTRAENGDFDVLTKIARPNAIDGKPASPYHDAQILGVIRNARSKRLEAQRAAQRLPRIEQAMGTLYTARLGQDNLENLLDHLDSLANEDANPIVRQGRLALAAYKAGLCVSANLTISGFDTHDNHDAKQGAALQKLFDGVDTLLTEAAAAGLQDKVVVMISSDFARTPNYNGGNGKDHWPYTSMIVLGAGVPSRVVGATTMSQNALRVNPDTLDVLPDDDSSGVRIEPAHVHAGLRKLAAIDDHALAKQYPVMKPDLGIFS